MPPQNDARRDKLIHILSRIVPAVARGVALGFAVLAMATAFFEMGDYATAADRYWTSGVYALVAAVGLAISLAAKPILRRMGGG